MELTTPNMLMEKLVKMNLIELLDVNHERLEDSEPKIAGPL